MKKALSVLLSLMLLICISACSTNDTASNSLSNQTSSSSSKTSQSSSTVNQPSNSTAEGNSSKKDNASSKSNTPSETPSPSPAEPEVTRSPIELIGAETLQYPSQNSEWKYNVYESYVELTEYLGSSDITELSIPSEIDGLPVWVLNASIDRNRTLVTVYFPENLVVLGDYAFMGCSNLTNIQFPDSLVKLGTGTFYLCENLGYIDLPNGMTTISQDAFLSSGVTAVKFPENLLEIESGAFSGCEGLSDVVLPSKLRSIGDGAFGGCVCLDSITIPASVEYIGGAAFGNCTHHALDGGKDRVYFPLEITVLNPSAIFSSNKPTEIHGTIWPVDEYGITNYIDKDQLTIRGYAGSTAAQYCVDFDVNFEVIN